MEGHPADPLFERLSQSTAHDNGGSPGRVDLFERKKESSVTRPAIMVGRPVVDLFFFSFE